MRVILLVTLLVFGITLLPSCSYFGQKEDKENSDQKDTNEEEKEKQVGPTKLDKKFTPTIKVETLWKKNFGKGLGTHYLKLKPTAGEGIIFISDREGQLFSIETSSGKVIWKINDQNVEYTSSPGIGDGLVFVGTGDGRVIARESSTGILKWVIKSSSEVLAAPTSSGGITIVRSADGALVGLDSETGSEIWNYRRTAPRLTLRGNSKPAIDEGVIFSALDNGRLIALDLKVGRLIWNKAITVPSGVTDLERMVDLDGDPMITQDFVYVSSFQGGVTALSKVDGQIIWARQISSYNGLARGIGQIYVVDDKSAIWALNEEDGTSIWKQQKLKGRFLTDPVFFENYIVVGDFEGYIHWIDAKTGEIVFRNRLGKKSIMAPGVVTDGILIMRSVRGKTIAMRPNKP